MSETVETGDVAAPPVTLTIPLVPPIVWQGGTHDSITLKEPTAGQKQTATEQLRNSTNAATIALYEIYLVSLVSGKPVDVVRLLPVSVLNRAMAYVDFFLQDGRRTGWS